MKAVVVNQASTGVEVVEHDLPKVGHGEALVKVEYCGVCILIYTLHMEISARYQDAFWVTKALV
ncbi:alcohol dehydrogenase [Streptococcus agalactiae]|nr:alcohol dehydrogenase [Streptococcus agalactiae]SUN38763.1 alcohol dehydrogenase [Streptococcus agalactiae]